MVKNTSILLAHTSATECLLPEGVQWRKRTHGSLHPNFPVGFHHQHARNLATRHKLLESSCLKQSPNNELCISWDVLECFPKFLFSCAHTNDIWISSYPRDLDESLIYTKTLISSEYKASVQKVYMITKNTRLYSFQDLFFIYFLPRQGVDMEQQDCSHQSNHRQPYRSNLHCPPISSLEGWHWIPLEHQICWFSSSQLTPTPYAQQAFSRCFK